MELKYLINLEKNEDGGYTVTVPSLPGCITQGDTWEEAVANAQEAIVGFIETLQDLGKPIPLEIPVKLEKISL
ncbi:MAG: type II toxin-antitoxin system HicB family antitoxin [candidate division WOR-3 bacterium]|nr:type II toxin-antitoxin system HicB family antitoxin [candidate division WOR-3 bacterium]